jgi:hypothetical protein
MKRIAYVLGGLAAAGAGMYLVVYLYRWQWQRAMICGVLLLVVEVMLFALVTLGRLSRIEERLRDTDRRQRELDARTDDVLSRLRQPAAAREETRFRWLEDPADRTYVFVPVLMVTGVLLSALAWVVQKIASATAKPAERRLAGRLAVLTAPDARAHDGLEDLPPLGAGLPRARTARVTAVAVVGVALLGALVVGLADLTQTREEKENTNEATSVLVRLDVRGAVMTADRESLAARQIWESCRNSTSVALRHAAFGDLGDGTYAGVVRPALTDHDELRLRGCLEDAIVERAHLTVVGFGDTDSDDD